MASPTDFPLVRGRRMRVTKTDGCCQLQSGPEDSAVTDGFVSIAFTANITEGEEITVTNANGQNCVRDVAPDTFDGYELEITFCSVQPCIFAMITGQPVVEDGTGNAIGFRMNSDVSPEDAGFALEVWMGVPGGVCGEGGSGAFGYLILPCVSGGVIGDFTIENAAVTFVIQGANTQDGNAWGTGPYPGEALDNPLDPNDHLAVVYTDQAPPATTDGCVTGPTSTSTATGQTAAQKSAAKKAAAQPVVASSGGD